MIPRDTAIRCEQPQGVDPTGEVLRAGDRTVTMFRAPGSGTEYMRISGSVDGDAWFKVAKVFRPVAA